MIALGHFQDRLKPWPRPPGADSLKPLMHQNAVVGVQRHHVGHAAQCHQIEQFGDVGRFDRLIPTQTVQACTQGNQYVEDHPYPGQRLAGELATRLVRVDDGIGRRQFVARQVVIGDQHAQPGFFRRCHAFDAGDPVVHGDQQLRRTSQCHFNDFWRQTVAVLKPVGHQVVDMGGAQQTQTEHAHGAGRGTVGVKVTDDQDALALFKRHHQQVHRRVDALELLVRDQPRQALVQFSL